MSLQNLQIKAGYVYSDPHAKNDSRILLRDIKLLDLGIISYHYADTNAEMKIRFASLSIEERKKIQRKFRKVWKKAYKTLYKQQYKITQEKSKLGINVKTVGPAHKTMRRKLVIAYADFLIDQENNSE